tara:strand:+ start:381 stop:1121 length:741 start_codon:yes stop_codon:yes gene_type:complete
MNLKFGWSVPILERVLGRPVTLDRELPTAVVIGYLISAVVGFIRGFVLTGRPLVLESGARITNPRWFHAGGGLVRIGAHSQIGCASHSGISVGRNFKLGAFSRMIASGTLSDLGQGITVGDNVGISEFAYIGGAGGLRIGSDVIVGQYFSTHPENHIFSDTEVLIREQGVTREGIEIGSDCWIGAKVTVLDGVSLGRGCVVAAGSVVNRSFPDYSIIGGVPARVLKMRERGTHSNSRNISESCYDN